MATLEGKSAIVTGSSSGIGEAVARLLAAEGAGVVVNSASSVDAGRAVAESLPDAVYVQGDISDEGSCQRLVDAAVQRWGRLDILVNNAGTTKVIPHHDLDAATDEVWRRIFEVNVLGTWHMTRAAVDALRRSGAGSVVNITSVAGVRPTGSSIPYAVSKAALNHLTALLANVLGPEIRVNAVAPGLIDTPWTADWDAIRSAVRATTPLKRSGLPDDVAAATLGLIMSAYATGQVLLVDGGMSLR
ncbi:MAG TPA: SDR family oxidoreductase [Acidimicrobiales bacterium]|nr:SDR family oxidoreductase [Acidimicrobiales bacterium]